MEKIYVNRDKSNLSTNPKMEDVTKDCDIIPLLHIREGEIIQAVSEDKKYYLRVTSKIYAYPSIILITKEVSPPSGWINSPDNPIL